MELYDSWSLGSGCLLFPDFADVRFYVPRGLSFQTMSKGSMFSGSYTPRVLESSGLILPESRAFISPRSCVLRSLVARFLYFLRCTVCSLGSMFSGSSYLMGTETQGKRNCPLIRRPVVYLQPSCSSTLECGLCVQSALSGQDKKFDML